MRLKERYDIIHAVIMDGPGAEMQKMIDSGLVWKLEGAMGRAAMDALRMGMCVLPPEVQSDYYGSPIPSYPLVAEGSPGSVGLAEDYFDLEEE